MNKRSFEVEVNDKKIEIHVVKPNHKITQQAGLVYNREFRKAVEAGLLVRAKVEQVMRDQNLWNDEKEKKYKDTVNKILSNELALAKGKIKLSEARALALEMRKLRSELRNMRMERDELDQHTAEAQAEQARFNYLVAACTLQGDKGEPYFEDVEDYLNRENDPVVMQAASNLGKLLYNLDDDFEKKLPENKFLMKYGFVDEKLRLVRKKDKKLVDSEGRLIDENGYYINENGEKVDRDGNLLTEDGDYKVDFEEFIDDIS